MGFDIEGARRAGYSEAEIVEHLAKQSGFDVAGARKAGYSDGELVGHLAGAAPAPKPSADEPWAVTSAAAGAGTGLGDLALRAQKLVGNAINYASKNPQVAGPMALAVKGARAVDDYFNPKGVTSLVTGKSPSVIDRATDWLVQDAERGQQRLVNQNQPYADANPTANAIGKTGAEVVATLPVGGAVGNTIKAVGARAGLPVLERLGTAVTTGGFRTGAVPTTLAGKAGNLGLRAAGGAINGGATAGVVDPEQAGSGALVGAVVPVGAAGVAKTMNLAGRGTRWVKDAAAPLNPKNDARLVGQFLRDQAGPDADAAVNALKTFKQTGSTLPGYQATTAEVARVPSFAALQRTATAVDPLAMNEYSGMATRNQDLLVNQLEDLAGRDGQRAFTDAMREETANRLYQQAYSKPIDPAQLTKPMQRQMDSLMQKPAMQEAMRRARVLGQNEGLDIADEAGSLRGLHYAKTELDSMIREAATRNEKRILQGVQADLLQVIDKLSPDYAKARSEYAAMSVPVNQFDVLEQIAANSITPRGTVTLNKFNRAATDKTVKAVLKRQDATLPSLLTPEQLKTLGGVRSSLEGLDFVANAGRGVGSDTVQKLATANRMPGGSPGAFARLLPGVTGTLGGILSQGANALYSGANRRLQERLTRGLLDPAEALSLLEAAQPAGVPSVMGLLGQARKQGEKALPLAYRAAPLLLSQ